MAANIVPLFNATAFDPATVKIISDAYDRACDALNDKGQPSLVNDLIARRIIALAAAGQRDVQRMCDQVLLDMGIDRTSR